MQFADTPNSSGGDLLGKIKQLVAENKSLTERLKECENIIAARENEIEILNQLVSEASEMRSPTKTTPSSPSSTQGPCTESSSMRPLRPT